MANTDAERAPASPQINKLRAIARIFDELVPIPGTKMRFGLDAILGLLPGGGDLVGGAVSAYSILIAARMGAPASVIVRMGLNIAIDTVVGLVPLLGDLFDASWKANRKNVTLLEQYTTAPTTVKRSSMVVVAVTLILLALFIIGTAAGSIWLLSRLFGS